VVVVDGGLGVRKGMRDGRAGYIYSYEEMYVYFLPRCRESPFYGRET
jgi:hypothetical protein